MTFSDDALASLFRRTTALEIATAWHIAKDERTSFTMDCIDLMQEDFAENNDVDKYDLEEMNEQFNEIMVWVNYFAQTKADPNMKTS